MKILSIGNSFSVDAHAYLKGVCDAAGVEIYAANLYIGGCSLVRHYNNMISNADEYVLYVNGSSTEKNISIDDALDMDEWDVITFQESSLMSVRLANFEPYITHLIAHAKEKHPRAKIAIHQTWGYGNAALGTIKNLGFLTPEEMFDAVEKNYVAISKSVGADIFIPSGRVLKRLYAEGYNVHLEDGHHAGRGIGRYALALTWLKVLFGTGVRGNSFDNFEIPISNEEKEAVLRAVEDIL